MITEQPNVWSFLIALLVPIGGLVTAYFSNRSQRKASHDAAKMDSAGDLIASWQEIAREALRRADSAETKADRALAQVAAISSSWGSWYRDLADRWEDHRKRTNPPLPPSQHHRHSED